MSVLLVTLLAVLTLGMAALGGQLAANKGWQKWFFWVAGILCVVLLVWQEVRTENRAEKSEADGKAFQGSVVAKLDKIIEHPSSPEQKQKALALKREVTGSHKIETPPQETKASSSNPEDSLSECSNGLLISAIREETKEMRALYSHYWDMDKGLSTRIDIERSQFNKAEERQLKIDKTELWSMFKNEITRMAPNEERLRIETFTRIGATPEDVSQGKRISAAFSSGDVSIENLLSIANYFDGLCLRLSKLE